MGEDRKLTIKNLLLAGIDSSAVVDKNGDSAKWTVIYAEPTLTLAEDYFKDKGYAAVVTVSRRRGLPWRVAGNNVVQTKEFINVHVWTVDSDLITGEKLKWILNEQLRTVFKNNNLEQVLEENDDVELESQMLYNTRYVVVYDSFGEGLYPGNPPNSEKEWGAVAEGFTGQQNNSGGTAEGYTGLNSNPGGVAESRGGVASAVGGVCEVSV